MSWIYLDNNATTMPDPQVVEAMLPYMRDVYANPSSVHQFGQQVRHGVDTAREQIAKAINARPRQILFTGGGTEANALAIRGALNARPEKRHFVTSSVEHDSVRRLAEQLEREGYRVTYVGVDRQGQLDLDAYAEALDDDTALVSIMHANNETGVIFPIEKVGQLATEKAIPVHVDATQTIGKLPFDVKRLSVQLVTMAPHKFHGPKGVGVLYLKRGMRILPQLLGGHQERDLRAGTENVAGIVGSGVALQVAVEHLDEENTRVRAMRDRLEAAILERIPIARVNGDADHRLPNTTNISFENLQAEAILMLLSNNEVCASSGSACSSGSLEPSHVLEAMGVEESVAHGAIRFSLSRFNMDAEIDQTIQIVEQVIAKLSDG